MPKLLSGNTASGPIVSLSLQGIIYGFSVCMFGMSVWVLAFQRRDRKLNAPMLVVACTLWILCTMRMFINIVRMTEAFTMHLSTQTGPEVFLSDVSDPVSLLNNAIYCIQTLIGDAVVIYRCYVLWGRFDIVIVPCMAWVASFATSLLAFRIWRADRNARSHNRPTAVFALPDFLYTVMLIMALVTILHFLAMEYVVNSVMPAVISITFSMIVIRAGLARSQEQQMQAGRKIFPLGSSVQFRNISDFENTGLNPVTSMMAATTENSATTNNKAIRLLGSTLTNSNSEFKGENVDRVIVHSVANM
ncbi:hypothetical protein B0H13DRAFT_2061310 [Mycena leptocephala]|nr:hypothetical protein B0H13DRAFT_2061310 [Mycena leptocephala]